MTPASPSPRFSVVIPTFNRCKLLRRALESVWAQTSQDYEIVVVDDGSTDDTWQTLGALGTRVRAFRQVNSGPGAARNLGARHASGRYVVFLDSDDQWFPDTLFSFAAAIEQHESPAVVCGRILNFSHRDDPGPHAPGPLETEHFSCYGEAAARGVYAGAGMVAVRRSTFLDMGGFDASLKVCEDHDLMLKLTTEPGFVLIKSPLTLARRTYCGNISADLTRVTSSLIRIIDREAGHGYPGGKEFAASRRHIISQHCRTAVLALMRAGKLRSALHIYARSLPWQLLNGRWKFVIGTPMHCLATMARTR